jgi:hypothetical protein
MTEWLTFYVQEGAAASSLNAFWPMRAAIPVAKLTGTKVDAIAVGTPSAAHDAEVQNHASLLSDAAAARGPGMLEARLAF